MTCYVYIIGTDRADGMIGGPCKVGISSSPDGRIASLQTGNPHSLSFVFQFQVPNVESARMLEQAFHEVKAKHRMMGEWFDMAPGEAALAMAQNIQAFMNHFLGQMSEEDRKLIRDITGLTKLEKMQWDGHLPCN